MKELIFILHKVGECGYIERHERDRLMDAYWRAWVAFAETVGEPFTATPDVVPVTAAQLAVVRKRIEAEYAGGFFRLYLNEHLKAIVRAVEAFFNSLRRKLLPQAHPK